MTRWLAGLVVATTVGCSSEPCEVAPIACNDGAIHLVIRRADGMTFTGEWLRVEVVSSGGSATRIDCTLRIPLVCTPASTIFVSAGAGPTDSGMIAELHVNIFDSARPKTVKLSARRSDGFLRGTVSVDPVYGDPNACGDCRETQATLKVEP